MYLTPVRAQSEKHTKVYMHLGIVLTANVSVLIVVSVTVPTEFTHYILHYKTHKCQISSEPNNALWTSWSQSVSGTQPLPATPRSDAPTDHHTGPFLALL